MPRRILQRLAAFAGSRYRLIFLVAAILVVVSLLLASQLTFDTDVLNLLPQKEPAVRTLLGALESFGSIDYLLVAVRIPPGSRVGMYEDFVGDLAERIGAAEEVDRVEYRIGEMEELVEAFLPKSFLFLDDPARQELVDSLTDERLRTRAMELRRLVATPQSVATKSLLQLDPLGLSPIFLELFTESQGGLALDWSSGYLLSRDHRLLLILAKPVKPPQDIKFDRQLVAVVNASVAAAQEGWRELVGPNSPPPPEVALGGRYVIALGDDTMIRRDAMINIATSMGGVLLLFLFAFRRFGPLLYAFVPLSCGLIFTFGFSYLAFGSLSSATSGIAALLIGLGIDFIIVSYGRYVEERSRGRGLTEALAVMNGSSGRAVVVGAVTSAATFFAFGVTEFTGLFQMGYLTGAGILLCMVAVIFLLPAMLAWHEEHHRRRESEPRLFLHGLGSSRLIRASIRHPVVVLLVGIAVTLVAGLLAMNIRFEDSVTAMRPAGNPGVMVRDEVGRRFGTSFDTMMLVLEGETLDEILELAERAATGARELVAQGVLTSYDDITSLIPPPSQQKAALEWLREERQSGLDSTQIRETFTAALGDAGLRAAPFLGGLDLLAAAIDRSTPIVPEDFEGSEQERLLLERYLAETPDGWKSVVYLRPPAGKLWRRQAPPGVMALADSLGPQAEVTGTNVVSEFLRARILRDAVFAAILGFVVVGLLLWLDYRRLRDTILSLAPLVIGILWMLGGMVALGLSMNFMNIFVSTMIIGIGVDYGVHMIHRYRELEGEPEATIFAGMAETGKAIVLAALSTMIGFGSLSLSHYPGLRSMGLVSILGALSTALVAITVLPAYLAHRLKVRRRAAERRAG